MKRLLNSVLWRQIGLVNIKHQDTGQKAIYSLCGLVGKILQIYHSTKSLLSGHFKAKGRLYLSYPNTLQFFQKPSPSLGESFCKAGDFPQHRCALLTPVTYKQQKDIELRVSDLNSRVVTYKKSSLEPSFYLLYSLKGCNTNIVWLNKITCSA